MSEELISISNEVMTINLEFLDVKADYLNSYTGDFNNIKTLCILKLTNSNYTIPNIIKFLINNKIKLNKIAIKMSFIYDINDSVGIWDYIIANDIKELDISHNYFIKLSSFIAVKRLPLKIIDMSMSFVNNNDHVLQKLIKENIGLMYKYDDKDDDRMDSVVMKSWCHPVMFSLISSKEKRLGTKSAVRRLPIDLIKLVGLLFFNDKTKM